MINIKKNNEIRTRIKINYTIVTNYYFYIYAGKNASDSVGVVRE